MTSDNDDFWGNQADWPELPETERKEPRLGAGARVSRWWNQLVGGSVEGSRHHGISNEPHPSSAATAEDFGADDFEPIPSEPNVAPDTPPARRDRPSRRCLG